MSRLDALQEIKEYPANTYNLTNTLIISNADGGAGYAKKDFEETVGCCESNHRKYTYRVKGQGKYWSEGGAESILRVLTCIKNGDLEECLSSEFSGSQVKAIDQEKLRYAVRNSLKKAHEAQARSN